jgi:DNA-binding LytR/AlgR family response regulator
MESDILKLTCLVVDDEQPAQWVLSTYIKDVECLELIGCAFDATEAFELMKKHPVDLLFLDINLPGLTGFDFLNTLQHQPMVVFTTAFSNYALNSFEYNVVDYLVKPITRARFTRAVERVLERSNIAQSRATQSLEKALVSPITIRVDKKMKVISPEEILYLQSYGNYVRIYMHDKFLITTSTTQKILEILPSTIFVRIHKSYIINKFAVKSYNLEEVVIDGKILPIGISFKQAVLAVLKEQ